MSTAIKIDELTKTFSLDNNQGIFKIGKNFSVKERARRLVALDKISFEVPKGEILGIIGMNGSGKTTLLRTIAGIYKPDSGIVYVKGNIAPILHIGTGFHKELTAKENIILAGMLLGMSKPKIKEKIDDIIEFAELQEYSDMKLKHYSTGMKARIAFSTSIQIDPDILLIDEILSVGDISFREKSFKAFLSFKEKEKTILYTTHNLGMIPKLCDRVLLLHHGKMITIGKPEETITKYRQITRTTIQ